MVRKHNGTWSKPKKVRVDSIRHYDTSGRAKRGKVSRGHSKDPIRVKGGRVFDGDARLREARRRGDKYITAHVAQGGGCLLMTSLMLAAPTALAALVARSRGK
jgi:hypothetical protein